MLISPAELASLQDIAESGMQTAISIYHGAARQTDDGNEWYWPDTPDLVVNGWLYEISPAGQTIDVYNGGAGLLENHRLMLPVGTDCREGDKVKAGSTFYIVQHTNSDDTYPTSLTLNLRTIQ